jgi:hypothetical protein
MTRDVLSRTILLATLLAGCAQSPPAGQPAHLAEAPATNARPAVIAGGTWVGLRSVGPDTATAVFVFNTPAFEKCLRARSVRPGERYTPPTGAAYEVVQRDCHEMRKGG